MEIGPDRCEVCSRAFAIGPFQPSYLFVCPTCGFKSSVPKTTLATHEPLESVLKSGNGVGVVRSLSIVEAIARIVVDAHLDGWVHGHLAPRLIWVGADGKYLIQTDIDLSSETREALQFSSSTTVSSDIEYLAPELLLLSKSMDRRADVYSLGAILFHLLWGKPPLWHYHSIEDKLAASLCGHIQKPCQLEGDGAATLGMVCELAMKADPGARYKTSCEFLQSLSKTE